MPALIEQIEQQALALSLEDRSELIRRLSDSLEGEPEDSPEVIAQAWDEEIARRVADMEAERTKWIPADQVLAELRQRIAAAKSTHAD